MTHTIIIETQNDADFERVKDFAQRLGVSFSEKHTDAETANQEEALRRFAGSWEGEETGDELAATLQNARYFRSRDIEL